MALLTNEPTIIELFNRLSTIDSLLMDFHISWDRTQRLLQERAEIKDKIQKLGYEP